MQPPLFFCKMTFPHCKPTKGRGIICGISEQQKPKGMEKMSEKKETTDTKTIIPSFSIYHPNPKGTGTAMAVRMSPARLNVAGYLQIELAKQQTVGDADRKVFPTFNWKERIIVRINPIEAAEIVRCMRGMTESIRDGLGFAHKTDGRSSKITFVHIVEPKPCYQLKVISETIAGVDKEIAAYIYPAEAAALEMAIEASMGKLCFGG